MTIEKELAFVMHKYEFFKEDILWLEGKYKGYKKDTEPYYNSAVQIANSIYKYSKCAYKLSYIDETKNNFIRAAEYFFIHNKYDQWGLNWAGLGGIPQKWIESVILAKDENQRIIASTALLGNTMESPEFSPFIQETKILCNYLINKKEQAQIEYQILKERIQETNAARTHKELHFIFNARMEIINGLLNKNSDTFLIGCIKSLEDFSRYFDKKDEFYLDSHTLEYIILAKESGIEIDENKIPIKLKKYLLPIECTFNIGTL